MNVKHLLPVVSVIFALAQFAFADADAKSFQPKSFQVGENFANPVGFYDAKPVFSWKLPIGQHVESQDAINARNDGQPTVKLTQGKYKIEIPVANTASIQAKSAQDADSVNHDDSNWRALLGETFDGWEVFTGVPHKSVNVPGIPPSNSDDGHTGTPIGLGDPLGIFKIDELDGESVLHVSGQVYAGLTSLESFSNYHLSLEYKWGEKKWPPRLDRERDSGLLIHCHGQHGEFWHVWMSSLECQIQETDAGDFYALGNTSAIVPATELRGEDVPKGKSKIYDPAGKRLAIGKAGIGAYCGRNVNHEIPDRWNRVEVMTVGARSRFLVNGNIVNELFDAKAGDQKNGQSLTSGRIQIQSEAAEIFYRNIKIRPLTELPSEQ